MDDRSSLVAALAGRYTIDRAIGRGGMAVVYGARDVKHDRQVAIKVLKPEVAAAVGGQRFLREIHIASQLQHPHVLPLHDSGEADGILYYVMPYVEGESLRARLDRDKQLPIPEAVTIAREVAGALSYAHSQGVVHRDIKPENILLSGGHAIVADFGIARAIFKAGGDRLTETGIAVGTPKYMSPEQAGGAEDVDPRSDIYSLGCVLYEMLAGEPPFTGRTAQAVLARQIQEPPPPLEIVRPSVSPLLQETVERALAKVPADRFATALELAEVLEAPDVSTTLSGRRPRPVLQASAWLKWTAVAAMVILAAFGLWLTVIRGARPLDADKVVGFPLVEHGASTEDPGAGERIALWIGTALEFAEPLKWLDGWRELDPSLRENPRAVTADMAQGVARSNGARFYLDGDIVYARDSATVTLRLHDVAGDSLVRQRSGAGSLAEQSLEQLAHSATVNIVTALIDPTRTVDLAPLAERDPGAVALWLRGQREYRNSQFLAALDYYRRAVEKDGALAVAALNGAQAASWTERIGDAERLIDSAVAYDSLLPRRHALLARGIRHYLVGRGDSAVARLREALQIDPEWSEAWMALGEAYYHLLPPARALDSLAEDALSRAFMYDPLFTPPLVHLTEFAIRRGDVARATDLITSLREARPDSARLRLLTLMLTCVDQGPEATGWPDAVRGNLTAALDAARSLSFAASQNACAEAGLRAILNADSLSLNARWNAVLALQSLLVAQGRFDEAFEVLDSALAAGISAANYLYVVDALAEDRRHRNRGDRAEPQRADRWGRAAGIIASLENSAGPDYGGARSAGTLWLAAIWHAHMAEVEQSPARHSERVNKIAAISRALRAKAATGSSDDALLADAVDAHFAAARGAASEAIDRFRSLRPNAPRAFLGSSIWQPLVHERMVLARLLAAAGEAREAYDVAAFIDYPHSGIALMYLPESLELRATGAQALGRYDAAERCRQRVAELRGVSAEQPPVP